MYNNHEIKVFAGSSSEKLAAKVASKLGVKLGDRDIVRFADGETFAKSNETVRGCKVFVIQSTSKPVNESLMELLIFIDSLKRASASEIIAVIPYYGYARQDRKAYPREPITSKLVADLLTTAGATRVVTMDLHARQIQGFFNIPVDHMEALPLFAKYFSDAHFDPKDTVVVSPDIGGVKRARGLARWLGVPLAIIDTAGTICNAAKALKEAGACEVYACAVHPVFSGEAIQRLKNSEFNKVVVTDTIQLPEEKKFEKLVVVSTASMFAETINRIFVEEPISDLFEMPVNLDMTEGTHE